LENNIPLRQSRVLGGSPLMAYAQGSRTIQ
jgi:hypothetical protein